MEITTTTVKQKSMLISGQDVNTLIKALQPVNAIDILRKLRDMCGEAIDYERTQSRVQAKESAKSFSPGYVPPTADRILSDIIAEVELIGVAQRMRDAIDKEEELERRGK